MRSAALTVGLKIKLVAKPMTPEELGNFAHQLAGNKNRDESARLAARITEGFYAGSLCQKPAQGRPERVGPSASTIGQVEPRRNSLNGPTSAGSR